MKNNNVDKDIYNAPTVKEAIKLASETPAEETTEEGAEGEAGAEAAVSAEGDKPAAESEEKPAEEKK